MSIFDRWTLGAKAVAVAQHAWELARSVDTDAVLSVLLKVVELERVWAAQGPGMGAKKRDLLLAWFRDAFPQYAGQIAVVDGFSRVVVALFNAARLFK